MVCLVAATPSVQSCSSECVGRTDQRASPPPPISTKVFHTADVGARGESRSLRASCSFNVIVNKISIFWFIARLFLLRRLISAHGQFFFSPITPPPAKVSCQRRSKRVADRQSHQFYFFLSLIYSKARSVSTPFVPRNATVTPVTGGSPTSTPTASRCWLVI